jgi:hypothetical protein
MYELSWRRIKNPPLVSARGASEPGGVVVIIMREPGGQQLSADRISHLNEAEFIELRNVNLLIFRAFAPYCNDKVFFAS